jgi:hypothetical protein
MHEPGIDERVGLGEFLETFGIDREEWSDRVASAESIDWTDPRLRRVVRFRLLTDPGFPMYDVSYCFGVDLDGKTVEVVLPFDQLPKRTWKSAIVECARRDGVHAKLLGFFDPLVVSSLSF